MLAHNFAGKVWIKVQYLSSKNVRSDTDTVEVKREEIKAEEKERRKKTGESESEEEDVGKRNKPSLPKLNETDKKFLEQTTDKVFLITSLPSVQDNLQEYSKHRDGPMRPSMVSLKSDNLMFANQGLEVKNNDQQTLQYAVCDVTISSGRWFFEFFPLEYGQMQVGVCTHDYDPKSNKYEFFSCLLFCFDILNILFSAEISGFTTDTMPANARRALLCPMGRGGIATKTV